jgi:hypothetical protein
MRAEFLKLGSSTGASQSSGRLPCLLYQADFLYVGRIGTPYPCFESPVPNRNVYAFGFVEAGHLWLSTRKDARSVVAQGQYYLRLMCSYRAQRGIMCGTIDWSLGIPRHIGDCDD